MWCSCLSSSVAGERLLHTVVLWELHPVSLHEKSPGCQGPAGGSNGSHWGGGGQLRWRQYTDSQGQCSKSWNPVTEAQLWSLVLIKWIHFTVWPWLVYTMLLFRPQWLVDHQKLFWWIVWSLFFYSRKDFRWLQILNCSIVNWILGLLVSHNKTF